ncbi:hypothetical protein YC2023_071333 [Brassica napus]
MWSLTTLERASYYRINKITAVFLAQLIDLENVECHPCIGRVFQHTLCNGQPIKSHWKELKRGFPLFCSTGEVGEGSIKPSHEVEMGIILDESGAPTMVGRLCSTSGNWLEIPAVAVYNEYKRTKASWRHIDFYDVDDASGILSSKPISIIHHHHQPLSHSSASTGFLDFSRNPNPHFNSSPFSDEKPGFRGGGGGDGYWFPLAGSS